MRRILQPDMVDKALELVMNSQFIAHWMSGKMQDTSHFTDCFIADVEASYYKGSRIFGTLSQRCVFCTEHVHLKCLTATQTA